MQVRVSVDKLVLSFCTVVCANNHWNMASDEEILWSWYKISFRGTEAKTTKTLKLFKAPFICRKKVKNQIKLNFTIRACVRICKTLSAFPFFGLNNKKKKGRSNFFLRSREDSIFLTCCLWWWNIAFNDSKMISVTSHRCFILFLTTRKCPLSQKFLFDPQKLYPLIYFCGADRWIPDFLKSKPQLMYYHHYLQHCAKVLQTIIVEYCAFFFRNIAADIWRFLSTR